MKKNCYFMITAIYSAAQLFSGCSKKNDSNVVPPQRENVFVAGSSTQGVNSYPGYWENGHLNKFEGEQSDFVNAIFISGSDVYAAGSTNNGVVKYWKNGVPTILTDGTVYSYATSIYVSGSDVYVTGSENGIAKYWKNGVPVALSGGGTDAFATGIVVSGADIYVSGYESGDSTLNFITIAEYWKNGVPVRLSNTKFYANANAIVSSGGDIYIAGNENDVAVYWKNGVEISLGGRGSFAGAIAVSGNNVYVAGYQGGAGGISDAICWNNGNAMNFTSGENAYARATGVTVSGTDVYVCGTEDPNMSDPFSSYYAEYWKNGNKVTLGEGGASAIFVTTP
jgi:hypothetical protein